MISNLSLANAPYLGLPGTGVANLSGRTHVFTTEDFGSNNSTGMTLFGQNGAATYNVADTCSTAKVNPYAVINQTQSMLADTLNKLASSNIDSSLGAVITQKNQLIAKYNSGNVSNEIKTVIQEQVKQLEDYERQLNALKTNEGQLDPQTAYQRSAYIKHGVENLINLSTTTIKAMEAQAAQKDQQASETQQGEKPETLEEKAQKVKEDNIYTRAGEDDLDKDAVVGQYYDNMIDKLYKAMDGCWGTDNDAFEEELNKINKDNIIPLMYQWNIKHPKESFMEMFMADANATQKKVYGKRIADAIEEIAKEKGIDLTDDEDMKAIKKEMNSWFWINNIVADNYNNLVKKLLAQIDGVEYNFTEYSIWPK